MCKDQTRYEKKEEYTNINKRKFTKEQSKVGVGCERQHKGEYNFSTCKEWLKDQEPRLKVFMGTGLQGLYFTESFRDRTFCLKDIQRVVQFVPEPRHPLTRRHQFRKTCLPTDNRTTNN